jgi:hypothetical protein
MVPVQLGPARDVSSPPLDEGAVLVLVITGSERDETAGIVLAGKPAGVADLFVAGDAFEHDRPPSPQLSRRELPQDGPADSTIGVPVHHPECP